MIRVWTAQLAIPPVRFCLQNQHNNPFVIRNLCMCSPAELQIQERRNHPERARIARKWRDMAAPSGS